MTPQRKLFTQFGGTLQLKGSVIFRDTIYTKAPHGHKHAERVNFKGRKGIKKEDA